jgi:hypothetical protein
VQARAARCLYEDLQSKTGQKIAQTQGEIARAAERTTVQLWLLSLRLTSRVFVWVEIEYDEVGEIQHRFIESGERPGELATLSPGIRSRVDSGEPGVQLQPSLL